MSVRVFDMQYTKKKKLMNVCCCFLFLFTEMLLPFFFLADVKWNKGNFFLCFRTIRINKTCSFLHKFVSVDKKILFPWQRNE